MTARRLAIVCEHRNVECEWYERRSVGYVKNEACLVGGGSQLSKWLEESKQASKQADKSIALQVSSIRGMRDAYM